MTMRYEIRFRDGEGRVLIAPYDAPNGVAREIWCYPADDAFAPWLLATVPGGVVSPWARDVIRALEREDKAKQPRSLAKFDADAVADFIGQLQARGHYDGDFIEGLCTAWIAARLGKDDPYGPALPMFEPTDTVGQYRLRQVR